MKKHMDFSYLRFFDAGYDACIDGKPNDPSLSGSVRIWMEANSEIGDKIIAENYQAFDFGYKEALKDLENDDVSY